jgi:hypothetical protein
MSASAARQTANAANARKHRLIAADLLIGPEDREEFNTMLADYESDVASQGAIQQTLFDELVAAAWNLRRIRRMETALCAGSATYLDLLNDDHIQTKLDRLARHKSRIERSFHRCLKELKSLQTTQAIAALLPHNIREAAPPLASTIEIAKRTQAAGSAPPFKTFPDAFDLQWIAPADTGQATTAA